MFTAPSMMDSIYTVPCVTLRYVLSARALLTSDCQLAQMHALAVALPLYCCCCCCGVIQLNKTACSAECHVLCSHLLRRLCLTRGCAGETARAPERTASSRFTDKMVGNVVRQKTHLEMLVRGANNDRTLASRVRASKNWKMTFWLVQISLSVCGAMYLSVVCELYQVELS